MKFVQKAFIYLNPIEHLGNRKYSIISPLVVNLAVSMVSEIVAYGIFRNPNSVGAYIIFINVALIIYFSFREGIRGGFVATVVTIAYYFYIIHSRHYVKDQLYAGIDTTIILAILYLLISGVIGWLKETIDRLIEIEADAKKRLETIIQQLPVGVLITDHKGRLVQRNKQLDSILGMKLPLGFVIGKDTLVEERVDGKPVKPSEAPLARAIATGKSYGREISFQRKNGSTVHLQVSSAPIHNKNKKIVAAASIISDISSRIELEKQKDYFLSMASHELKTPITSLKLFSDLQEKQLNEKNTSKAKYFNAKIKDQINKLKELVNDLLDVSRIETGKLHLKIETFDICNLVQDAIEGLQGTTDHKLILKPCKDVNVIADRYRVYQVLANLLTNAVKYSPHDKRIIIEIKKIKRMVIVSVQDFGIGIDLSDQTKIFDRLYQVSDAEEKTFPGLGLGLFISKQIIERQRGKIWVESVKGKGSTFYFSLPTTSKKK